MLRPLQRPPDISKFPQLLPAIPRPEHWQLAHPTGKLPHSLGIASGERLLRPRSRSGCAGRI